MTPSTAGELLHCAYANLAMAHSAVAAQAETYGRVQYMVRARLYKGLNAGTMTIDPPADDEKLKMVLPQACCYCASKESLSIDHLIPTKKGGDNLVCTCRFCNSSKCASDVLEWLFARNQFPPLLVLRRYLKLAIEICKERQIMDLPFSLSAVPLVYPKPGELRLWVTHLA